jgi:hypothetical protein
VLGKRLRRSTKAALGEEILRSYHATSRIRRTLCVLPLRPLLSTGRKGSFPSGHPLSDLQQTS